MMMMQSRRGNAVHIHVIITDDDDNKDKVFKITLNIRVAESTPQLQGNNIINHFQNDFIQLINNKNSHKTAFYLPQFTLNYEENNIIISVFT